MCTLALVTAGGLVTSNDAALAVPDWPLSWGRLVPPLEGGIRYDFAHRVLAAAVAILIAVLAVWTQAREPRPWMRKLAWSALAAVLAQAALGGALVKLVDPKLLSLIHILFPLPPLRSLLLSLPFSFPPKLRVSASPR